MFVVTAAHRAGGALGDPASLQSPYGTPTGMGAGGMQCGPFTDKTTNQCTCLAYIKRPDIYNTAVNVKHVVAGGGNRIVGSDRTDYWVWDATQWLVNARVAGIPTGTSPVAGSIVVFGTPNAADWGHVQYVEQVQSPTWISVDECNYDWQGSCRYNHWENPQAQGEQLQGYVYGGPAGNGPSSVGVPSSPGSPPPTPVISAFASSPSALPYGGGQVTLSAAASNATSFAFASTSSDIEGLTTVSSSSGSATDVVTIPSNSTQEPVTITFSVTVNGPGGSTSRNVSLTELASPLVSAHVASGPTSSGADFCRETGPGPNNVSSFVQCTPFNGTSFGSTATSSLVDWGVAGSAVWVPTSSGADFCRETGPGPNNVSSFVQCTPFNGTSFGSTATSSLVDWGVAGSAVWVPTSSGADFCRETGPGPNNVSSFVQCTPFNGTSFGSTATSSLVDWGVAGSAVWVPTSSGADFCRETGPGPNNVSSYVQCTPFNGTSFGSTATSSLVDWGVAGSAVWVPTSSGADYCREAGPGPNNVSSYVRARRSTARASGRPRLRVLSIGVWPAATVWVPTSSGADYCRETGPGPNNVSSYVQCTPFNGTSFGSTATSSLVDWGVAGSAVWVPTSSGADFCRRSAPVRTT